MTTKTRYFVIVSLLVLAVGLGTGLVAYYVGFPASASASRGGPDELQLIPRDATVVAFANVQEVMSSELRQKVRRALPGQENGQRELQDQTGINLETDIDRVVACLRPDRDGPGAGMVLARGRFDETKIEALMREHGAQVEEYKGKRLIVADVAEAARLEIEKRRAAGDPVPDAGDATIDRHVGTSSFALAFIEPGLAALGSTSLIRSAIDLHQGGANPQTGLQSVTGNDELMNLVRSLDSTGNAWAVGRFDALTSQARLPENVASQLPAITWFSVGAHVNGGIRGVIRAETRDDEAATNLRDVVRGFLALGKMQAGSKPELQAMIQSLELGGTGKTVALSFTVPAEVFDLIGTVANKAMKPRAH